VQQDPQDRPPAPPVTGRRWPRRLVAGGAAAVAVVTLLVAADVVLTRSVRSGVVRVLQCLGGGDPGDPQVSVDGPVLVDLVGREIDEITVRGLSPTVLERAAQGGSTGTSAAALTADADITLTLHGVSIGDPPTLRSAEVMVGLPWDTLTTTLADSWSDPAADPQIVGLAEQDGLLAVRLDEQVAGAPVTVLVSLEPDGGRVTATPRSVVLDGRTIGVGLLSLLGGDLLRNADGSDRLAPRTVDLELPDGVSLSAVTVRPDGLEADLSIDPDQLDSGTPAVAACLT